ncbi:protein kinase [Streptomyces sp. NPDC056627]|uniref:serine/threonine-protein kinase n=1 Tax=Streptomyces sp. NPDC056627 TaxID=3345881 RepID=UPI002378ACCA|nr:serine/threonine-protein kinase [Streptomyces sp. CB02058]
MFRPLGPQDPRETAGYRLLARIGEGGMGTVYLSHTRGGQAVALKLIRQEFGDDPEFRRRFEQEVQAARRVQGYHLVPVVDHDTSGPLPWLASAYVPGVALHTALEAYGPLPLPAVFQLVGCTAQALAAIHAAGVVHRDLKPGNILLGPAGPCVIDFGIARAADATQLTRSGGIIGTPQFMSPEHALGDAVGPATDVFSLGLIAALAATGRHPYGAGGAITIAAQIANTSQRPPRLDGYPDALRPVLERCLAADPRERVTPAELAEMCERAAGRSLRDFGDWLPPALTAEIARRETASQQPPPAPAQGTTGSGWGATVPPGTGPAVPPPATDTWAPAPPDTAPRPGATAPPAPTGPAAPARRVPPFLLAAGAVVALVLAVVVTWTIASPDDKDDDPSAGPGATTRSSAAAKGDGPSEDAGSGSADPPAGPTYTEVFADKPLTIRAPAYGTGTHVDLDAPKLFPNGRIGEKEDLEMTYQDWSNDDLQFLTPMGRSAGTSPQQCRDGADTDTLPSSIPVEDLKAGEIIAKGTVLCTVTAEGALAMLEVTDVLPNSVKGDLTNELPDFVTKLTLWKIDE